MPLQIQTILCDNAEWIVALGVWTLFLLHQVCKITSISIDYRRSSAPSADIESMSFSEDKCVVLDTAQLKKLTQT